MSQYHYVSFPKLSDHVFTFNRTAVSLGPLQIRWYGVILTLGFILGALYLMKRAKQFGTDSDTLVDLLLWLLPCSILGARFYYVFHQWGYYKTHLSEIPRIWEGGLAIYGGVIVGVLVIYFFGRSKKRTFDTLNFLDLAALGLMIGQIIGRWGNFVNGEAFGTATSLPWGMVISQEMTKAGTAVHPTFLYESLWNLAGFLVLHFYSRRRKFKGEIFAWYGVWYGLGRAWIEGLRTDSLYILNTQLRVSQVLSFAIFAVAAIFLIILYSTKKYRGSKIFDLTPCEKTQEADENQPSEE